MLAKKKRRRRIAVTVGHFLTAPFLLQTSDLVATEPARLLEPLRDRLGLTLIRPPFPIPAFAVSMNWHRRHDNDPGCVWLRELVAGLFAE